MNDTSWKQVFFALAAAMFVVAGALLIMSKPAEALVAVVAVTLILLATRLRDILKVKVSKDGLEAELREAIDEARATVAELHLLAGEMARVILDNDQASGRWGGRGKREKEDTRQSILATLRKLKMPESQITEIGAVQNRYVHFDYAHWVTKDLGSGLDPDRRKRWNEFFDDSKHGGFGSERSPKELEDFLGELGLITDEVKERLADYRHFEATKTHRRPDAWFAPR